MTTIRTILFTVIPLITIIIQIIVMTLIISSSCSSCSRNHHVDDGIGGGADAEIF